MNITDSIKQRFNAWWNGSSIGGRPMIRLCAQHTPSPAYDDVTDYDHHMSAVVADKRVRDQLAHVDSYFEHFAFGDIDLGPGAMAAYLGSEPGFTRETVWYHRIGDYDAMGKLQYNPNAQWYLTHMREIRELVRLSNGDYPVAIPDVIENIDILASLRGNAELCMDLYDEPDTVSAYLDDIQQTFTQYYDDMYDAVKLGDDSSVYTAFCIWGEGRTAKVQCDFSALMSPAHFKQFVLPTLTQECDYLDNTIYHLDGPDAIRHLDAIMGMKSLNALQWTPGAGKPDGVCPQWYPIYDTVRAAGKSLWVPVSDGSVDDMLRGTEALLSRYGCDGVYLLYFTTKPSEVERIAKYFGA